MRYFIYCRKSTEAEDRQILSIESQLTTLQRTFGGRAEIEIADIYEESFSAKAPGRTRFNEMLSRIEKGEADGIVAWAPDRLARNSIDGGRVIYLLDCGIIRDLKFATYTFENNSQGKFMLQIMFGQSKYYSDALSENVKRGNRTKIEKGWRPNRAPLGYLNEPQTRTIVKDPERFPLVRQMFDLMLTGAYPVRRICEIARYEWGFRTPKYKRIGGKPLALCSVYRILTQPFYAGMLVWNGRVYQGAHEPVVSIEEFERVQQLLGRREKPRAQKYHFSFTGMIRCGECGHLVTAENKTNRYGSHYIYYHCTKRKFDYRCQQRSVTAAELERQIIEFLGTIAVPQRLHDWITSQRQKHSHTRESLAESSKQSSQKALEATERALTNLTSLRVRDLIGDEEFLRERRKLEQDQLRLQQGVQNACQTDGTFEPAEALISFSRRAIAWFSAGDWETKRLIFEAIGSNPRLEDKILKLQAKKPFRNVSNVSTFLQLRGVRENIRTLYANKDEELLLILDNIRKLEIKFGIRHEDGRLLHWAAEVRQDLARPATFSPERRRA